MADEKVQGSPGSFTAGAPQRAAPGDALAGPAKAGPSLVQALRSLLAAVWAKGESAPKQGSSGRELIETVVFVVVLVLLLKSFTAEAFVIPTGSMATTLYGYQKIVTCPQCGLVFPVNCSSEVEDNRKVRACTCPNCHFHIELEAGPNHPLRE
jgi:hypothetical protein